MRRRPALTKSLTVRLALVLVLSGCVVPDAIPSAGVRRFDAAAAGLPASAEPVEIQVDPEVCIRGAFVAAGPEAPVMVHLLGAKESATEDPTHGGGRRAIHELVAAGVASLIVDYEGVGLSDGDTDVRNFPRDALAIWGEAVRRAGGRPDRVAIRATSMGCIAAALILDAGARPASVTLIAPIRPDTVVQRYTTLKGGWFRGWVSGLIVRDVADVDLLDVAAAGTPPLLVFACANDELLSRDDQFELRVEVLSGGGCWIEVSDLVTTPGPTSTETIWHAALIGRGRRLFPEEAAVLDALIATRIDTPADEELPRR